MQDTWSIGNGCRAGPSYTSAWASHKQGTQVARWPASWWDPPQTAFCRPDRWTAVCLRASCHTDWELRIRT